MYPSLLYAIPPGRSYTSLEKLYFPFAFTVWLCISVIFVVAAISCIGLKLTEKKKRDFFVGKRNNMPFFNMVNICLGGTIALNHVPMRNFARTMLIIWLISTLILRNAYQGKLFDYLRNDQHMAPLFNLDDLYQSDLELHVFDSYYKYIVNSFPELKSKFHEYDSNNLLQLLMERNPNHAYLTVAQMLDYFTLIKFPNFNVLKTKQYIKLTPICMCFRKHSCLLKTFNNNINALISGGLIDFWASKYRPRFPIKPGRTEPKPLSLDQISGIFKVCAYLMFLSVILFILELFSPDYESIKILIDFLTFTANQRHKKVLSIE